MSKGYWYVRWWCDETDAEKCRRCETHAEALELKAKLQVKLNKSNIRVTER